jgi:hypothetical protein
LKAATGAGSTTTPRCVSQRLRNIKSDRYYPHGFSALPGYSSKSLSLGRVHTIRSEPICIRRSPVSAAIFPKLIGPQLDVFTGTMIDRCLCYLLSARQVQAGRVPIDTRPFWRCETFTGGGHEIA